MKYVHLRGIFISVFFNNYESSILIHFVLCICIDEYTIRKRIYFRSSALFNVYYIYKLSIKYKRI